MASGEGQHCPAEDASGETGFLEALHSSPARGLISGEFETCAEKPANSSLPISIADVYVSVCTFFAGGEV